MNMKLFTFLIDRLKKWWVDESSSHLLRGFLLWIWQGLCLPVTRVYGGLRALGTLVLRVEFLMGNLVKGFSWFFRPASLGGLND